MLAGVTVARVNVIRESDSIAESESGNASSLRSVPHGSALILWKEAGTGVKRAVVPLNARSRFAIFELSGTWIPGNGGSTPPEPDGRMKLAGCTPKSNEAEWHITYKCDLNSPNCNRLCFLPPTTPDMTLDDSRGFNRQARELGWFPKIVILGGEPTLHSIAAF